MDGIQVIHDSQSNKYRRPFGAVQVGEKVKLSIDISKDIMVAVQLTYFDGVRLNIGMEKEYLNDGSFRYSTEIDTSNTLGVLEYYFILIDGYNRLYYGNNDEALGGIGQIYNYNPVPYQITVYENYNIPSWYKEGVIYQILVDRFYNGNESKSINEPKENSFIYGRWDDSPMYIKDNFGKVLRWDFYGGNLKGIIEKLDYIKSLGANIIEMSPIFKSLSCHKYDTEDYEVVDEMFGTNEDFKELCRIAKSKGIRIILDGVFSYTSSNSKYFNKSGKYGEIGAYQSPNSKYYDWYKFRTYPYQYESWWGMDTRPNLNTLNEGYLDYIINGKESIIRKWIELGASGWKLNVTDELPDEFIELIKNKINESSEEGVLLGDVWEDASNKISYSKRRKYLLGKEIDSVTNYPLRESLINFIKGYIKSNKFKKKIMSLYENYPMEAFYANINISSTNDTERILTVLNGNIDLLKLLIVMQIILPGVPSIYYGDEVGLTGGKEPDNRKSYPWGKEKEEIITFYRKIISIRNKENAIKKGDFKIYDTDLEICYFERNYENDKIMVFINVSEKEKVVENISVNGNYSDLFEENKEYKFNNKNSNITISKHSFKVLKRI